MPFDPTPAPTPTTLEPTPADILRYAMALLTQKGWTQGAQARLPNGEIVHYTNPDAAEFCAIGAIFRAGSDLMYSGYDKEIAMTSTVERLLIRAVKRNSVETWNDCHIRTKAQVLAAFHKALALAPA